MDNSNSIRDKGDHILLLPASHPQSQISTPSIATVPSFLDNSGSNISNNNSIPSISLSHRGPTIPPDPQTGSSTSVDIPTSTSTNRGGDSGHQSSISAADSSVSSNYRARASEDAHGHSPTFLQQYIILPAQSFKAYLSSPDRESIYRNSKIPPWILPQYRGRKPILRSMILRPLCRLLLVAVILGVLMAATIIYSSREGQPQLSDYSAIKEFDWPPIQPRSYLSPMNSSFGNEYDVLLDGHSHTTYSDGRMSPETLIKWHIGECCRLHMNLIGINETIDFAITKWPTDDQLRATIKRTHDLGGLAIINHIPWSNTTEYGYQLPRMQHHPSREALVEMGIDGIEIANGGTLDTISLKFIQDHNLLLMAGADVHYPDSGAFGWTILNTNNNRTQDSIMAQLRARRTSFLFDPTGTQPVAYPPESVEYYKTAPPTLLGQYFQMFWSDQTGMYSFSPEGGFCHEETVTIRWKLIGFFVAWVLVGFLLFEAARLVVVGCCWGPFQRRRKFKQKQRMLEREQNWSDHVDDGDVLGA
ncbi:hypothetical protein BG006_006681 [Podila minutissima]|uniref:Uncharacterized protein n=1 Tax=Podila minutissima TaxID=64525 RepID=A0A9P5SMR4_9FUNG|nr:hypothetical protein BG006_006681 [Podila minutissima]